MEVDVTPIITAVLEKPQNYEGEYAPNKGWELLARTAVSTMVTTRIRFARR